MTKPDRLSRIIEAYLQAELELDTAVAELTHVYLERGWRFSLIEEECEPEYRPRMRLLAARLEVALHHPFAALRAGSTTGRSSGRAV